MQFRIQGKRYQFIRSEMDPITKKRRDAVILSLLRGKLPVEEDVVEHLTAQEMVEFEVWRTKQLSKVGGASDPLSRVKLAIGAATEAVKALPILLKDRAEIEEEIAQLERLMHSLGYEP